MNHQEIQMDTCCEHCGEAIRQGSGEDLRCACGSLLARYVGGRLQLKCRRCKRTVMVSEVTPDPESSG